MPPSISSQYFPILLPHPPSHTHSPSQLCLSLSLIISFLILVSQLLDLTFLVLVCFPLIYPFSYLSSSPSQPVSVLNSFLSNMIQPLRTPNSILLFLLRTANNTTAVPYVGPVSVVLDVWMFNLPISLHHLLSPCGHLYTWHPPQPHLHPARGNSALSLTPTPRKHSHHPLLQ